MYVTYERSIISEVVVVVIIIMDVIYGHKAIRNVENVYVKVHGFFIYKCKAKV